MFSGCSLIPFTPSKSRSCGFFPVSYSASCYFQSRLPLPPPSMQNSAWYDLGWPLLFLPFCFLHCFILMLTWEGNNQRGSQGRRQYGHASRNREAEVRSDGQGFDTPCLDSPYPFLSFLLSVTATLPQFRRQRDSRSKTNLILCLQREASKRKLKLYRPVDSAGQVRQQRQANRLSCNGTRRLWGLLSQKYVEKQTQSPDSYSLIYFNEL